MNHVYDYSQIEEIERSEKKLICSYAASAVLLLLGFSLACFLIKNNFWLAVFCGIVLFSYILFSVVFWKIKYGLLHDYKRFLDQMESGYPEDYFGTFLRKELPQEDENPFDTYIFSSAGDTKTFLIQRQNPVDFEPNRRYHIVRVGKYTTQWEAVE